MSDRGRCHADEQGPCKAPCCPIKDQAAPAWCRPDPHPLCQVDPEMRADETRTPFPHVTVAPHVDSAPLSMTAFLQQTMTERMARILQQRYAADMILAREAATPEQVAASVADEEKRRAEMAENVTRWRDETRRARHELAALAHREPVARMVLELHSPYEGGDECEGCDPGDSAEGPARYPCRTVRLIGEHYGITMPERWIP